MGIRKEIEIDGKMVAFKASAAIPRIYRLKFQRDIYKDLAALEKSIGDGDAKASNLDMFFLEMFENIAFIMAKHADPTIQIHRKSGWMSLILFPFIRFCHS